AKHRSSQSPDIYPPARRRHRPFLPRIARSLSPNDQRLKMLSQMVEEYQVDGVVDVILQACHTYAVESLAIKRHVRQQHNIPYIAIETDYSTSDVGQLSTRVAAFIEML
ncbi:2-hydroxyacyl-CoA dehydratase family protein, partial [Enterobacter hormaechei subsp. steigerwaltii]|nr:2-hydroxyacyl-CoA dehydratase family protein [Enterobacter hormaechei subsp. steigerwaltii]